jgi:diguanylate cyclase (GGDEF)-like protein/PAS domain S-box-containing protein
MPPQNDATARRATTTVGLAPSRALPPAPTFGSTDQLDALLANTSEVVATLDAAGEIRFVSRSVRTYLGYEPAALVGRRVAELMRPDQLADFVDRWSLVLTKPGSTLQPVYHVRHADGSWVAMVVDFNVADLGPLGVGAATVRPVDRVSHAERELRAQLQHEDRLVQLASTFVGLPTEEFDDGVHRTLALLGSMRTIVQASIFRVDGDDSVLTHGWQAPGAAASARRVRVPLASSPFLGQLGEQREVMLDLDGSEDLPAAGEAFLRREGLRSVLSVPMVDHGRFAGFLSFGSNESGIFQDPSYRSVLRTAAGILSEAFTRHAADEQLARQARVDLLTGLANRWAFDEALTDAVARLGARTLDGFSVLLLDLDRFKVVNDSLGHQAGDALLATVADRLRAATTTGEHVARFGGDEIVVLLEGRGDADGALLRSAELVAAISKVVPVGAHDFAVTASGGLAVAEPGLSAEELLRRADAAMFLAKERGRRRIEVFDDELRRCVNRRLRHESELQRAVRDDQLVLHYQPEIEVATGRIVGAEALVRWDHPTRGIVTAGAFVDTAEETGAILEIGDWAITQACGQLARWQAADLDLVMRVNLSARQVCHPGLAERVATIIDTSGIDPAALCLEITETAIMIDAEQSMAVLGDLADQGLQLAIDDFGIGYSSLEYLKRFPVHGLKIDRTFVSGLAEDPKDAAIVRAILSLAWSLGLHVTAEGVETEDQRDWLLALGCERAQGWFYAPSLPPGELEALVGGTIPPAWARTWCSS